MDPRSTFAFAAFIAFAGAVVLALLVGAIYALVKWWT